MAEPTRIGLDGCVLPAPITAADEYLAAIFDELQALNAAVSEMLGGSKTATEPEPEEIGQAVEVTAAQDVPAVETAADEPALTEIVQSVPASADSVKPVKPTPKPRGKKPTKTTKARK